MPESVLHNGDPTLQPHAEHTARDAGCIWLTSSDALNYQAGRDLQIALLAANHLVGTSVHAHLMELSVVGSLRFRQATFINSLF